MISKMMQDLKLELAAEYLVMAAMLAEIKSRLLLPRPESIDDEEGGDPRAELIRRLQEYERFKKASEDLDALPRVERDIFISSALAPEMDLEQIQPDVELSEILKSFKIVMNRARLYTDHMVGYEVLSIRERMTRVLSTIKADEFTVFTALFNIEEGRMGVVVTLIAILELIRQSMIEIVQSGVFAPIYVKAR